MNQIYQSAHKYDSGGEVMPALHDCRKRAEFSAANMTLTRSSKTWHGNCTKLGVSKTLDWLVL